MPERVARRKPCEDFERFEPLFRQCQAEIQGGGRRLLGFKNPSQISAGRFFVLSGLLVYVDSMGERSVDAIKKTNARLRCIFENGTESDLLLQSLASNLYKNGRRVTEPHGKTLQAMGILPETPMASVYILRSLSTDPQLAHLPHLHKIGSTRLPVEQRVTGAETSTTFLGAPVKIVAEYMVPAGIEKSVESLLHRIFADVRLDVSVLRGGESEKAAREWFAVPLPLIDEAVKLIESQAITDYEYDAEIGAFVLRGRPRNTISRV